MGNVRVTWCVTVVLAAVFAVAALWIIIDQGGRITPSADPGAGSHLFLVSWCAAALLVLITWATSRGMRPSTVQAHRELSSEIVLLIGCAIAFPIVMRLPLGWQDGDYVGVKVLLLLAVPGLGLWFMSRKRGRALTMSRPTVPVLAVVGVLLGIGAEIYVTQLSPWAPPSHPWPDTTTLVIAATATLLTASIGEEIFYRYWLQTRLEARIGRLPGLLLAALLFGVMHLTSHGGGLPLETRTAAVIAHQGVFGLATGYLWTRYRRLWMPILLHALSNGLLVLIHLSRLT